MLEKRFPSLLSLLLMINFHIISHFSVLKPDCFVISLLLLNLEFDFQEISTFSKEFFYNHCLRLQAMSSEILNSLSYQFLEELKQHYCWIWTVCSYLSMYFCITPQGVYIFIIIAGFIYNWCSLSKFHFKRSSLIPSHYVSPILKFYSNYVYFGDFTQDLS